MTACIFALTIPVIPLFLRKLYKREEKLNTRETVFRYIVYTFLTTVLTALAMVVLCDEGPPFWKRWTSTPLLL